MAKLYGSIPRTTWEITSFSPNDITASTFMTKYNAEFGPLTFRPDRISIAIMHTSNTTEVFLMDWGGSIQRLLFTYSTGAYNGEGTVWGFQNEPAYHSISSTSSREDVSKQVQKLYGSVNGQTKLITKLYGSVNGLTKLIYQE